MSLMNKSRNKLDEVKIKSMGEILGDVLKATSGTKSAEGGEDFNVIFNKIVGFRGVRDGLGTSLFVSNLAVALANQNLKICVVDTAMLYPVQDTYLKTKIKQVGAQQDEVRDWFDLQYSDKDVLNISSLNQGIVVLSFTERNLADLTSISDTLELGQGAIDKISPQFDLVLVDIANEYTSVGLAAMQACDVIYQVWSNDRASLASLDSFISNMLTQAIPYGKMQQVILLSAIEGIMQSLTEVYKRYGFKEVARVGLSETIARENAVGRLPVTTRTAHEDIEEYKMAIADVAKLILNVDDGEKMIAGEKVEDIIERNTQEERSTRTGRKPTRRSTASSERLSRGTRGRRAPEPEPEPEYSESEYEDDYDYDEDYFDEYPDEQGTESFNNEDYYEDDGYDDNSYDDYDDEYDEPAPKKGFFGKSKGTSSSKEPKRGLFGGKKSKGR